MVAGLSFCVDNSQRPPMEPGPAVVGAKIVTRSFNVLVDLTCFQSTLCDNEILVPVLFVHTEEDIAAGRHTEERLLINMKDQIHGKQSLARSETNSERELNEVAKIETDTTVSTTHLRNVASKTLPGNELQVYQTHSNAMEAKLRRRRFKSSGTLRPAHRECLEFESPLKGTPWEEAMRFSHRCTKKKPNVIQVRNLLPFPMEDQLAKDKLSTQKIALTRKSWEEYQVEDEQSEGNILRCTSPLRKSLENEQQVSQTKVPRSRSDFKRVGGECSELESPLKGKPWEDAEWDPITSRRNRKPRREKREQEEECVEFWL
ncbi:hypothetical protein AWC38_SpisGene3766 [Stylophora pistillata]|uniref:Uncharacterized protein n=1 Tax=Stylophora pistillata TaxID=50429 RepID=A0A2B4SNA7_STYPI|nr:hypothetical protein AWC38_SpisGene3766 [Stylophora pistillata]